MMVFVYGGAGSGKSEYAEALIVRSGLEKKCYVASMEPAGADAAARIARHRALRRGKGFETVERFRNLAGLEIPPGCAALLEDLSNLFANEWFGGTPDGAAARVMAGLEHLRKTAALSVIVGNDLFSDGLSYDRSTAAWLEALAALNRDAAAMADAVCEVVCGIPIRHKGEVL